MVIASRVGRRLGAFLAAMGGVGLVVVAEGATTRASDEGDGAPPRQEGESDWDVTDPGVPRETLSFEATEGTWISVDVDPRGERLVFDLLGDIYTLPVSGGRATRIAGGRASGRPSPVSCGARCTRRRSRP